MAERQTSPSSNVPPAEDEFSAGGKRQEAKKCGVCGDRALGYNFNAITCESCKAFFRRNALKNKEFRCPFQGQCRVDQVTRRFCQKCRLRKCLEIGMKKEWIMTEEEKRRKKQKIEENRARKIGDVEQDDDDAAPNRNEHDSNNPNNNNSNNISSTSINSSSSINSNNNENNNNSNNVSVISAVLSTAPSSSTSSPPSSFPPLSSSSCKPQAVVVGIIREEETQASKVARLEEATDVHHHPHKNQMEDSSPSPSLRDCEYLENSPFASNKKLDNEDCGPPLLAPSPALLASSPPHMTGERRGSNPSLLDLFAISIKKEVECTDEHVPTIAGATTHNIHPVPPPPPPPHYHHHHHHLHPNLPPPQLPHEPFHNSPPPLSLPTPSPPPHGYDTNGTQQNLGKDCDGFSVREAMEILHPEEKNLQERNGTTAASVLDVLLDTAITAEFSSPFSRCPAPPNPQALSEAERAKLEELSEANKGILAPLCEDYNFKDLTNPSLINIINLTEIVIRRLIKMAKRISAFKNLCQEDQIALLKGGCTEMMLLHSVCAYDPDKDSWKIQQDPLRTKDIKLKVLKAAPGNVYEEHKRFVLAFDPEWKQDPHIIFLLCAITLFNPKRQHIIHPDAIRHEQGSYLYLTRRYLEARYGTCLGLSTYHQLLHRLAHLHHLSEDHLRLFLEVNPTQVEPLLIEIFDLKHR